MQILTIIGVLSVIWVFIQFVRQLGKSLPILEMMLLIAGLQWIIGPVIEYNSSSVHYKYYMYVPEVEYMGYIVPAYLAFGGIIFFKLGNLKIIKLPILDYSNYEKYGLVILSIGILFDFIGPFFPDFFGFFVFVLANFKFAGAIILYFSKNQKLRIVFYLAILYLFLNSLANAMFHDFILWSAFFFIFWTIQNQPSLRFILFTFIIGGFFLVTLQAVKSSYRAEVWGGYSGNKVGLFSQLFFESLSNNPIAAGEDIDTQNNVRLNQGWIISAIMDNVPEEQPFFEGKTISDALSASLLPRFLAPEKVIAGGRENFRNFTGLQIGDGTSMGISIIGEAYGNFDVLGGIIFMGIWGWFLVTVWLILVKYGYKNPLFFAVLPIVFLQVIKAETELVVVLNHLTKSLIVVFAFFYFVKKVLKWKLYPV
ncbi:hypothetical protein MMU07_17260 [Aquiflexum sp. LQ15W]|uniref:hypothetical protein n=1 Tax=Cognataquiflexum nitidum TaxID=2922272 RepID=UPI001F133671|nr:hypothetical protein [Cognataquiflexum nitidum]MCH6201335.1 hypothetical protein [Cognataquiflexum nitidum]